MDFVNEKSLEKRRKMDNEECGSSSTPGKDSQTLVSLLECPICADVSLPIYQCSNGHIICEVCWKSLTQKTCPTCRVIMDNPVRNRVLEQIIQNFNTKLPCKFAVNGCPEKMLFPQKEVHQTLCPFKNYECPLASGGCKWVGRLSDIVQHLKGRRRCSHAVPVLYGETITCFFTTEPDADEGESRLSIQVQSCLDTFFLIIFKATYLADCDGVPVAEYSALVQHVGLKELTNQFAYRLSLERDGRRLSWEAVPLSISDEIKTSLDNGDCLSFNTKTSVLFKNEDTDMIPIDVTINKLPMYE